MSTVQSQSFNPFNYSSNKSTEKSLENIKESKENINKIISKGDKNAFKIDIGHFGRLCKEFKDKHNLYIKNLDGKDKENFKLMVTYVRLLHGTNYYEHLYKQVKKYFGELSNVKPGTVGGYFGGCLSINNFKDTVSCSASCGSTIPTPNENEEWSFCDKAVFFAEYNPEQDEYEFTVLKESKGENDLDSCYVFVEHTDLHDFKGFTRKEKEQLKHMGIHDFHLIGCNTDGTKYINLYGDVCSLKNVKNRKKYTKSNNTNNTLIIGLAFMLALAVLLFFGWKYWQEYKH